MKGSKELSFTVHYKGDLFKVSSIHLVQTSSMHDLLHQIINELIYDHDQTSLESELHIGGLLVQFQLNNEWKPLESKDQLVQAHHIQLSANPQLRSSFLYIFCDFQRAVLVQGMDLLQPESCCNNKWCHMVITHSGITTAKQCLIIRGEGNNEVIAVYCSLRCAMCDRRETLQHVQRQTLISFRFLLQRTRKEIRLMRILKMIHDNMESRFRGLQRGVATMSMVEGMAWKDAYSLFVTA